MLTFFRLQEKIVEAELKIQSLLKYILSEKQSQIKRLKVGANRNEDFDPQGSVKSKAIDISLVEWLKSIEIDEDSIDKVSPNMR